MYGIEHSVTVYISLFNLVALFEVVKLVTQTVYIPIEVTYPLDDEKVKLCKSFLPSRTFVRWLSLVVEALQTYMVGP